MVPSPYFNSVGKQEKPLTEDLFFQFSITRAFVHFGDFIISGAKLHFFLMRPCGHRNKGEIFF
jgi:hypothetical protein